MTGIDHLCRAVRSGDRRALARAVTLVESRRADHRDEATRLLHALGHDREALRIGLSGTPGVGKSKLIEAFGLMLTAQGSRVAVLAVDPSSARSGGSILGDKTRMADLARHPRAFIRPSAAQAELGGVARRTREAVALCEAAGFDVVIIETVGVGQSETLVAGMSDLFVLLMAPAGGDELQGVKRGIMEAADLILVNKADGDFKAAAERTRADYAGALRLFRHREGDPENIPTALTVSALTGDGLDAAWRRMQSLADWRRETGYWARRREAQRLDWFREEVRHLVLDRLASHPDAARRMRELSEAVSRGEASPVAAAADFVRQGGWPNRLDARRAEAYRHRMISVGNRARPFALARVRAARPEPKDENDVAPLRTFRKGPDDRQQRQSRPQDSPPVPAEPERRLADVESLGRTFKLKVSAHALRTVDHRGGLDSYLIAARDAELSDKARKIKRDVEKALATA